MSRMGKWDEIDYHAIRCLTGTAEIVPVANSVYREPLVLQRLLHSGVNASTEVGNRRLRRSSQNQGHEARNHSRHRLHLWTDPPTDRKIEHNLGTFGVEPALHECARCGDHGCPANAEGSRQPLDSCKSAGGQRHRRRRPLLIAGRIRKRQPETRFAFRWKIVHPILLIVYVLTGHLVFQLAIDEVSKRAKERRGHRFASSDCGIDICYAVTNESEADSVRDNMMATREKIEFICSSLKQCEFEKRAGKGHRLPLNRRRQPVGVISRMFRVEEIKAIDFDLRVVDRLLKHLSADFENRGSQRLGLPYRLDDGPLE
nr:hypothetical protein CPGR_00001 [Mycolicibacterium malmesburyense]